MYAWSGLSFWFYAAGRLIRHQRDYGAVLLLDHRYNMLKFRQLTPAWLQPLLTSTAMSDAPKLLQKFFFKFPAVSPVL